MSGPGVEWEFLGQSVVVEDRGTADGSWEHEFWVRALVSKGHPSPPTHPPADPTGLCMSLTLSGPQQSCHLWPVLPLPASQPSRPPSIGWSRLASCHSLDGRKQ